MEMTEEKVERRTERENSSSAGGTTSMTRLSPSASMRQRRGETTCEGWMDERRRGWVAVSVRGRGYGQGCV